MEARTRLYITGRREAIDNIKRIYGENICVARVPKKEYLERFRRFRKYIEVKALAVFIDMELYRELKQYIDMLGEYTVTVKEPELSRMDVIAFIDRESDQVELHILSAKFC